MAYSKKQIQEVKIKVNDVIEYMQEAECGKIEINFNRKAGSIVIIPQPQIKIHKEVDKKSNEKYIFS